MTDIIHSVALLILSGSVLYAAKSMHDMIKAFQNLQRSNRDMVAAIVHHDMSGYPEHAP